jgi:hypothetical protein
MSEVPLCVREKLAAPVQVTIAELAPVIAKKSAAERGGRRDQSTRDERMANWGHFFDDELCNALSSATLDTYRADRTCALLCETIPR